MPASATTSSGREPSWLKAIPNGELPTDGTDVGALRLPSCPTRYTSIRLVPFSVTNRTRCRGSINTWAGLGWAELSGRVAPGLRSDGPLDLHGTPLRWLPPGG